MAMQSDTMYLWLIYPKKRGTRIMSLALLINTSVLPVGQGTKAGIILPTRSDIWLTYTKRTISPEFLSGKPEMADDGVNG
mmetsp:Transcript_18173/g.28983  ORF Transcript_18173/g.28983 Transcript_18173/m.28983 type:complete len:80 (+) Transcript_18173:922-1161(+)